MDVRNLDDPEPVCLQGNLCRGDHEAFGLDVLGFIHSVNTDRQGQAVGKKENRRGRKGGDPDPVSREKTRQKGQAVVEIGCQGQAEKQEQKTHPEVNRAGEKAGETILAPGFHDMNQDGGQGHQNKKKGQDKKQPGCDGSEGASEFEEEVKMDTSVYGEES